MFGDPLTEAWRLEHVRDGDAALKTAHEICAELGEDEEEDSQELMALTSLAQILIQIAQAHYQAANVRARPVALAEIHKVP